MRGWGWGGRLWRGWLGEGAEEGRGRGRSFFLSSWDGCGGLVGGAHSAGGREGAVDIEEADGVLDGAVGERRDDARSRGGGGHGMLLLWCCDWYIFLYVYVCVWLRALEVDPLFGVLAQVA